MDTNNLLLPLHHNHPVNKHTTMKNTTQTSTTPNFNSTVLADVIRPLRNEEALRLLKNNTPIEISTTKTKMFMEWVAKKEPSAYFLVNPSVTDYRFDVLCNYIS